MFAWRKKKKPENKSKKKVQWSTCRSEWSTCRSEWSTCRSEWSSFTMNMRQQVRKVRERASRSSPMVRSGIQSRFIRNSHRRVPTYHMKFFNVKFSDKLTLFVLSEMKSFPTKFQKICSAHKYSILLCTRKLYTLCYTVFLS